LLIGLLRGVDTTDSYEQDEERDKDLHLGLHTVLSLIVPRPFSLDV
jgi:hypothetical protein